MAIVRNNVVNQRIEFNLDGPLGNAAFAIAFLKKNLPKIYPEKIANELIEMVENSTYPMPFSMLECHFGGNVEIISTDEQLLLEIEKTVMIHKKEWMDDYEKNERDKLMAKQFFMGKVNISQTLMCF